MTTEARRTMNVSIGQAPAGAPRYGGMPMTLDIWIARYLPAVAKLQRKWQWANLEKLDGPFDASDLLPPGVQEPARYPAYYFMKPVHTHPKPYALHPAFGSYSGRFQGRTQFYFTKPETVKYWLNQVFGDTTPKRAIDIGCGTGTTTFAMAELWPECEVIGVDLSPSMLRWARRKAEQQGVTNVRFYHRDGGDLRVFDDESFDVVNESYILHEMPTYHGRAVISEMIRLAKPGHRISWFDWPPAEGEGDMERRRRAVKTGSEPFMLQYLDLRLEQYLPELGLIDVHRPVRAGANMLVAGTKPGT